MEYSSDMNTPEPIETDSYSEIGQLLRRAREEARLSTDQASRLLHIRVRYLEALEEGRLKELPGLTYTRGYLQAYAAFLGLDKDEILRRFEGVAEMLARKNFYFPQVFSKDKTPSHTMVWGGLGVSVFIYVIWVVAMQPSEQRVSVVEKFPSMRSQLRFSAELLRDVACLRDEDQLYPPCTAPKDPNFDLTPLRGRMIPVMELATPGAIPDETEEESESE